MMYRNGILNKSIYGIIVAVLATFADATAANVVPRQQSNANRVSASRPTSAASRMPTMAIKNGSKSTSSSSGSSSNSTTTSSSSSTTTTTTTTNSGNQQTTTKTEEKTVDTSAVENKSAMFGGTLSIQSTSEHDAAALSLAEMVRAQRAALDAADVVSVTKVMATDLSGTGENACDSALRQCMIQKCGSNFGKCVGDTDTTFFDKMDSCRRTTDCTGHEYQLLSAEIKADRDLNAKLSVYNATIDCGNNYDTCIVAQCGATYSKCIGKSAGDQAIKKCESIAKSCVEYDSGLAMRAMSVFGEVRQSAERQIATDERKLYELRDQMRSVCTRLGAMFDERSLDCVYTVNFYADGGSTLYASKKAYAGSVFDCTQNWFGIDITTFRENAFRATRAQTAASSAMLGSGLGQATGALTSGAISRAIDRHKAEKALKEAEKEDYIDDEENPKPSNEGSNEPSATPSQSTSGGSCTKFDDEKPAAGLIKLCMPVNGMTKNGFMYDYTVEDSSDYSGRGWEDEVECERFMGVWDPVNETCNCGECRTWDGESDYTSCLGPDGKESIFQRLWCDTADEGEATELDLFEDDLREQGLWRDEYGASSTQPSGTSVEPSGTTNTSGAFNPSTHTVSGRVLDANGNGIEGVTVGLEGSDTETKTDSSGHYSLTSSEITESTRIEFVPDPKRYEKKTLTAGEIPEVVHLTEFMFVESSAKSFNLYADAGTAIETTTNTGAQKKTI